MSYSTDVAKVVADQLVRFVTLNRHQLAGQVANLDFWLDEVRHALDVIDWYGPRFERLRAGQQRYVDARGTTEFVLGESYLSGRASPPRRVPDGELRDARRAVCEAAYRFLVRCCREGFIDAAAARTACDRLGIGVDPADLRPERLP